MTRPRRVLVVDDSVIVLEVARLLLERAGFSVRTAIDLAQLDDVLSSWSPELVVTDVSMPELDGQELCRRIRGRVAPARVPLLLLSGLEEGELEAVARRCGADAWFCKHHGLEALPAHVRALAHDPAVRS
jgi:two-component system KDP operon response regulator KdpE